MASDITPANWNFQVGVAGPIRSVNYGPRYNELVWIALVVHFVHDREIVLLVHQMIAADAFNIRFGLNVTSYGEDSIIFTTASFMNSIDAQVILQKIEHRLRALTVTFTVPRRKTVWSMLRENLPHLYS